MYIVARNKLTEIIYKSVELFIKQELESWNVYFRILIKYKLTMMNETSKKSFLTTDNIRDCVSKYYHYQLRGKYPDTYDSIPDNVKIDFAINDIEFFDLVVDVNTILRSLFPNIIIK